MKNLIKKIKHKLLRLEELYLILRLRIRNRPYKILPYKNRRVRRIAKPVTAFDAKLRHEIQRMNSTITNQRWGEKLGIAAPQVGINKRMFICLGKVYINPEWTPTRAPKELISEGCYSIGHGKVYKVPRAKYGWAKWQNIEGKWIESKIRGLEAIVFQHELSHLEGKCCCDEGELEPSPK